ncbi:SRPBCC family protein [bacterium]|nr:SRPBCC family protein [bacterium]
MALQLEVTTPSDTEILLTRSFKAPRQLVWDAHTRPELIRRWLTGPPGWTFTVCEVDLRVGGRLRFAWRSEQGEEMGLSGEFKEVDAPSHMVHSELFDVDWTGGEAIQITDFDEANGVTTMRQTMRYSSKDARDGAMHSGVDDGMEQCYRILDAVLAERL